MKTYQKIYDTKELFKSAYEKSSQLLFHNFTCLFFFSLLLLICLYHKLLKDVNLSNFANAFHANCCPQKPLIFASQKKKFIMQKQKKKLEFCLFFTQVQCKQASKQVSSNIISGRSKENENNIKRMKGGGREGKKDEHRVMQMQTGNVHTRHV